MATTVYTHTGSGATTWQCPAGVNVIQVECWGYGGNPNSLGAAGGGGAYAKTNAYPVVPGTSYSLDGYDGAVGGTCRVWLGATTICQADRGLGGGGDSPPTGGAGGLVANCVGDVKVAGGSGGNGREPASYSGGGGGCGNGTSGNGTNATASAHGTGGTGANGGGNGGNGTVSGNTPGGGAGGYIVNTTSPGVGQIKITYTTPENVSTACTCV